MKDKPKMDIYCAIFGRSEEEVKDQIRKYDIKQSYKLGFELGIKVGATVGALIVVSFMYLLGWVHVK